MNNIRLATFRILRAYATRADAGLRRRLAVAKMDNEFPDEFEEFHEQNENIDEGNIMEITEDFVNSSRDTERSREKLRQQIVKAKVFTEPVPRFLTLAEIQEIRKLHENDPEEWTPERLSESFPALPNVIKKILNIKWAPKNVEAALYYDKRVIENWKQFKSGKLVVPPKLKEHLMTFKNRKIELMDRETMEKRFVPPKIEFQKPRSSFFTCILHEAVRGKRITDPEKLISSPNNAKKDAKQLLGEDKRNGKAKKHEKRKTEESLVFADFLKKKLSNLDEVSAEERVALVETYRKETEPKNVDESSDILNADGEKRISAKTSSSDSLAIRRDKKYESKAVTEINADHASLDTYVKERVSFMDTNFDYTKPIRIPKNVYKEGMTYRIKDCYYDYDGQFLFRVPGLKD